MPLSVGDKLGHYEVVALLGAGGMGEVYRARDTTLKRDVALKILPAAFVRDPERMARFQREAEVLDFGLAKVLEDEPTTSSLANSPTLTLGHTRAGMILGTAAYMSPEQAVGRPVDRRTDIFSFGTVLYEMLTGKRAFL